MRTFICCVLSMMKGSCGAWRAGNAHSAKNYVKQREFPFVSFCERSWRGGLLAGVLGLDVLGCDRTVRVIAHVDLEHLGDAPGE